MSDTEWFIKKAGDSIYPSENDPSMFILGSSIPDWVRTPPQFGNQKLKVIDYFTSICPLCKSGEIRHLALEGGIFVAECLTHGFVWYEVT